MWKIRLAQQSGTQRIDHAPAQPPPPIPWKTCAIECRRILTFHDHLKIRSSYNFSDQRLGRPKNLLSIPTLGTRRAAQETGQKSDILTGDASKSASMVSSGKSPRECGTNFKPSPSGIVGFVEKHRPRTSRYKTLSSGIWASRPQMSTALKASIRVFLRVIFFYFLNARTFQAFQYLRISKKHSTY